MSDVRALDPARVGQKAAQLSRLFAAGFAVPPGAVIDLELARRWPEHAAAVVNELRAALPGTLAVRSSATAEDLVGASYAGMYATVLNVDDGVALKAAVERVIASAHGERVRAYHGDDAEMAVLVQEQIDADAAGVAFTADPITGERDVVVIHAVEGLGERLVSGEADAEEWTVRGAPECVVGAGVLDAAQVSAIAALARRVEQHDGAPRDIEWALKDGELWLLQARPITALPIEPELPDLGPGTWAKDAAHFNEPITPFGFSTYVPALTAGMSVAFAEFGVLVEGLEVKSRGGELYGRPKPVGGKDGPAPPAFVIGVLARLIPALRARMGAARDAVRGGMLEAVITEWNETRRAEFEARAEALLDEDLGALSDDALLEHLARARALLHDGEVVHFRLFMPYVVAIAELAFACRDLLGWEPLETTRLLAGLSTASAAPTRALAELAELAAERDDAHTLLGKLDDLSVLDEDAPELAAAFRSFVRRHGWRSVNYDPGTPTLAEQPRLIARLVLDRLDASQETGAAEDRAAAEREARNALEGRPADLERFEQLLGVAQRCYPIREDNTALTDNTPCGLLRRSMMECGRRLVRRGQLARADAARFLDVDELASALLEDEGRDLVALTQRRHAEARWLLAHPGPDVIGPPPHDPPDTKWLPAEGRRINAAIMWFMDQEMTPPKASGGPVLRGRPGSAGKVRARVRVVRTEADFSRLLPGEVLVCPITSPVWSVLFGNAAAIVTDAGSAMSHAAVIAREHCIPAVLATGDATRRLRDGQWVTVDGNAGTVTPDSEPG